MLSKEVFLKGIQYLKDYYTNFNFDIDNDAKIDIWFSAFNKFNDEQFKATIKAYCRSEIYAPQSPTHVIKFYTDIKLQQLPSAESEWELVRESLTRYGINYNHDRFYKSLNELTGKVVKMIESEVADMTTSNRDYVRKEFITLYNQEIQHQVKTTVIGYDKKMIE